VLDFSTVKQKRNQPLVLERQQKQEKLPCAEIGRIELPPGTSFVGVPHTAGTREYLTCERGRLELVTGGDVFALAPGDVVVFNGDQRHSYRNGGRESAVGYSVVLLGGPSV